MNDATNHSPDLGSVRKGKGLMESFESKPPNGLSLIAGSSERTPDPFDGNRFLRLGSLSFPSLFHVFFQPPLQESSID